MANFETAFQEGLQAYQDAARAKAEIGEVIRDFSDQVNRASGGAVMAVGIEERVTPPLSSLMSEAMWSGKALGPPAAYVRKYKALVASGRPGDSDQERGQELCTIRIATSGYPVSLKYADLDIQCHDRPSLELALAGLLKDPDTGAKVARLMNAESSSAPSDPMAKGA